MSDLPTRIEALAERAETELGTAKRSFIFESAAYYAKAADLFSVCYRAQKLLTEIVTQERNAFVQNCIGDSSREAVHDRAAEKYRAKAEALVTEAEGS